MKNIALIITGPTGSGKGRLVQELSEKTAYNTPPHITTRALRPEEIMTQSEQLSEHEFRELQECGGVFHPMQNHGNHYGYRRSVVDGMISAGKSLVFQTNPRDLHSLEREISSAVVVILMPDEDFVRQALRERNTETTEGQEQRFQHAKGELEYMREHLLDTQNKKYHCIVPTWNESVLSILIQKKLVILGSQ